MIFWAGLHASLPKEKMLNSMPYFSLNVQVYEMILRGCISLAYEKFAFG